MKKISSPCINKCNFNHSYNLCTGCFRTGEEIFKWIYFSEETKKNISSIISKRKAHFLENRLI
tara:strand:+ start:661 stop:849 length:189 start_codon:yes stop_codon:yes gene_type:complete